MKDVLKLLKYFVLGIVGLLALNLTYQVTKHTIKNVYNWIVPGPSLEELVQQGKIVERKPANR